MLCDRFLFTEKTTSFQVDLHHFLMCVKYTFLPMPEKLCFQQFRLESFFLCTFGSWARDRRAHLQSRVTGDLTTEVVQVTNVGYSATLDPKFTLRLKMCLLLPCARLCDMLEVGKVFEERLPPNEAKWQVGANLSVGITEGETQTWDMLSWSHQVMDYLGNSVKEPCWKCKNLFSTWVYLTGFPIKISCTGQIQYLLVH